MIKTVLKRLGKAVVQCTYRNGLLVDWKIVRGIAWCDGVVMER